jgi:hypothetical protein
VRFGVVSAVESNVLNIEAIAAFLLLGAVAFVATVFENRADLLLEIGGSGIAGGGDA